MDTFWGPEKLHVRRIELAPYMKEELPFTVAWNILVYAKEVSRGLWGLPYHRLESLVFFLFIKCAWFLREPGKTEK